MQTYKNSCTLQSYTTDIRDCKNYHNSFMKNEKIVIFASHTFTLFTNAEAGRWVFFIISVYLRSVLDSLELRKL